MTEQEPPEIKLTPEQGEAILSEIGSKREDRDRQQEALEDIRRELPRFKEAELHEGVVNLHWNEYLVGKHELILQTGMRISEVANVKTKNVKDEQVKIEAYATQPERTIPLNKPAKVVVDQYIEIRPTANSPHIFVSKNGKPLAVRNIRAAIDRYFGKADIPDYSVNDLRTTFIVENLKAGVDLVMISQVVGHKRLSTTERYLELAQVKEPGKKQSLEEL